MLIKLTYYIDVMMIMIFRRQDNNQSDENILIHNNR